MAGPPWTASQLMVRLNKSLGQINGKKWALGLKKQAAAGATTRS